MIDLSHIYIPSKRWIDIKEHGHIDTLARSQSLLLKAEALDLGKIRSHLPRRDAVRGHANDVLAARVRGREKRQRRLARQHAHLALLRHEPPRQDRRRGAAECHADARVVGEGLQPLRLVLVVGAAEVRFGFDGLAAPAHLLADLDKRI